MEKAGLAFTGRENANGQADGVLRINKDTIGIFIGTNQVGRLARKENKRDPIDRDNRPLTAEVRAFD